MSKNLKIGDVFTIGYDPDYDPTGYFSFLKNSKFKVIKIFPDIIKVRKVNE